MSNDNQGQGLEYYMWGAPTTSAAIHCNNASSMPTERQECSAMQRMNVYVHPSTWQRRPSRPMTLVIWNRWKIKTRRPTVRPFLIVSTPSWSCWNQLEKTFPTVCHMTGGDDAPFLGPQDASVNPQQHFSPPVPEHPSGCKRLTRTIATTYKQPHPKVLYIMSNDNRWSNPQ